VDNSTIVQAVVTIGFGALAGGLTNAVAIWMLFHPHKPIGPKWFNIQGAIPKNRPRLAKTIGRTVGERLLTLEDLTHQLSSPGLREAFDNTVRGFVEALLTQERSSLREELSPALATEIEHFVSDLGPRLADRLADFARSDEFRAPAERILREAAQTWSDRPVGDVLTDARREVIRDRVEAWVAQAVASDDLEGTVRGWLDRQIQRLAGDHTPLLERLPEGLVRAVEKSIAGYLPVALERIAAVLQDPHARTRIEETLHQLFRRFVKDLMLHERIVASLVVTERTISRMLDTFGQQGAEDVAKLLDDPTMRKQVAHSVNDAAVSFLSRPLAEHIETLGSERLEGLRDALTRYILMVLRDESTRTYAIERLDRALLSAEQRTWGDLLEKLPTDRAVTWLGDALQSQQAKQWIAEAWASGLTALLDRPIGRPATALGEDSVDRIAAQLSPALWDWTQRHVPTVVAQIDIRTIVEQKVLSFSLTRIEEIVRATTQRELDIIVRLGFVLGAMVGSAAFALSWIRP